ncbi:hypothetical protein Tco_0354392 [Tanacetum coccineum]
MDEVLDCFLLDGPLAELPKAASLQPCIEQLSILIHHAEACPGSSPTDDRDSLRAPGEASISAAPLSVEDYAEEDTDDALGSVVAAPHLERCCL